jgi:ATP-dependent 26S proteasome regulatory subunit/tRNA uridine 5-carbamoylmethylation protein Kti12
LINRNFLIILVGLPASGKSTIATILKKSIEKKNYNIQVKIVDPDQIRKSISPDKFNFKKERLVRKKSLNEVKFGLKKGSIIISDDLNYYASMRHDLKQIAEILKRSYFIIHIATPLEKCIEWNKRRGLPIPQEVIYNINDKFDLFNNYNWDKPLIIIDPSKSENLETNIENLINIIEENLEIKTISVRPKRKKADKDRYHEKVDKITRNLISEISKNEEYRPFMKKISKMRKEFIKKSMKNLISDTQISEEFLKVFIYYIYIKHIKIIKMGIKNPARKEAKLRIEELEKSRSGRSLAYIDQNILEELGLTTGNIIEIRGKKKTAGIVVSSINDRGKGIIRLDGLQRLNAGATIGEFVVIKAARVYPAQEIVLTPTKANIDLIKQADAIKAKLIDKPVVIGDIVDVLGAVYQKNDPNNPMNEIMSMFMKSQRKRPTLGLLRLIVENTVPSDKIVKITRDTAIKVNKRVAVLNVSGGVVTYDDVGGLTDEIQRIREMVELPLKHPELFHRLNIDPPKGVLFYGPSGTGKTLMAKAVSQESNAHFITINGPEIMSKFYGASEGRLRDIFREAEENSPSIIFIDEIDSIAPKRVETSGEVERRVVSQLLSLMDGLRGRGEIICIGATNRVNALDEALRRPGRFDREIEFGVPNQKGRKEIFQIHTRGMPLEDDIDLEDYAEITYGFVGADIMAICREAAMFALRKILPKINLDEPIPSRIIQELKIKNDDFMQATNMI